MPIIIGTLTFMSKINFVLSSVEHEKSFITLRSGELINTLYFLSEIENKSNEYMNILNKTCSMICADSESFVRAQELEVLSLNRF